MNKLGNAFKLYLTTAGTNTYVAGETSSSINITQDVVEVSDKESRWKKYIAGLVGGTVDATIYADEENAEQGALLKSLYAGEVVQCFLGEVDGTDATQMMFGDVFSAIVTSISTTYDNGAAISRSVSLQITGEVSHRPDVL